MLEQVGKGARNNATITVPLRPSGDGEGLPTACLAIGKYGPIIASQYTAQTNTFNNNNYQTTDSLEHLNKSINFIYTIDHKWQSERISFNETADLINTVHRR